MSVVVIVAAAAAVVYWTCNDFSILRAEASKVLFAVVIFEPYYIEVRLQCRIWLHNNN